MMSSYRARYHLVTYSNENALSANITLWYHAETRLYISA